jgi:hypothetical protein
VYDSLAGAPLAAALVQFMPLEGSLAGVARRTVETDSAGAFDGLDLPAGRYLVGFFHPRLDSLGLEPPTRRLELRAGRASRVELGVPSAVSIIAERCGVAAAVQSGGVLLGSVRDALHASQVQDAFISAQWSAISISGRGARALVQRASGRSNHDGRFEVCGVPRGGLLALRAAAGDDTSGVLELEVPDNGVLVRDLFLARGHARAVRVPPLQGVVLDPAGGPLAGVRVRLWGSADETRSDAFGAFSLVPSTLGTHLVEARMVGFVPLRRIVDVLPSGAPHLELRMTDFPMEIDTVRVLSRRPPLREALAGFERRRRLTDGHFLDAEAIERRRPRLLSDLLRGIAGVEIVARDELARTVSMRAHDGRNSCEPALIIDAMRLPVDGVNIDDVVPADLVRAIEVYPRRLQAPPEYQAFDCGSVVIWTGLRGWLGGIRRER